MKLEQTGRGRPKVIVEKCSYYKPLTKGKVIAEKSGIFQGIINFAKCRFLAQKSLPPLVAFFDPLIVHKVGLGALPPPFNCNRQCSHWNNNEAPLSPRIDDMTTFAITFSKENTNISSNEICLPCWNPPELHYPLHHRKDSSASTPVI